ncbi:uncharacterized protein LOC131213493, partial [Anopheles bellator]|uniref:uncharacterized protein LOC131213493 n=1 Tax=Anopheles bellator TaxID=139047 RepID=UPI00264A20E7
FLHVLELTNLQYLKLELCSIVDGGRIHNVAFPELRHMVMINSGTCIRIDNGFSNIRTFTYTMDMQLPKLCRYMVDLEDFEIEFRTNYSIAKDVRDYFHHLPTLANLRVLRLSGIKTNTRPWQFAAPMPAVERLVLRKCHLARCDFKLLPPLFPSVKLLELDGTIIAYKRHPQGVDPLRYFEGRLKEFFPGVLVLYKDCQAVPLPTVLEMEDDYRWRLKEIREMNILDIKAWGSKYNRRKYNRHKWSTGPVHLSVEDILYA